MPSTEQLDQKAPSRTLDRESIPNLDLQALFSGEDSERASLVQEIRTACRRSGLVAGFERLERLFNTGRSHQE